MAFIAKQRYKLDLAPKGGWVIVYASQHDDGAREIEFEITNQGRAFSIPASINVSVQGIKINGSYFSHSCSYSGNIVTMALADDMTDIVGKAICVLKFTNSSQQKLATAKFVLNVDTDSSSEGIIIDTEAEEIFNQMLNEIRAQAASVSADIAELQSMVGTPLVASTVSAMTNHNKIYVYTGSESGYTSGNWYYWNGSAWTSGGVYNSIAVNIDSVPTAGSTNPVQSGGVKSALDGLESKIGTPDYTSLFELGHISISDSGWVYSASNTRVRTKEGTTIHLKAGVTIGLTDYTDARYYVGWLTDGTYGTTGAWKRSDYTTTVEGDYVILIGTYSSTEQSSSDALASLFFRSDDTVYKNIYGLVSRIDATDANLETANNNLNATNNKISRQDYCPLLELGSINFSESGWAYTNTSQRVRTRNGITLHIKAGVTVGLTDYTDARFCLGWKKSDGTYENIAFRRTDFVTTAEGDYVVLIANYTGNSEESINRLGSRFFVDSDTVYGAVADLDYADVTRWSQINTNVQSVNHRGFVNAPENSLVSYKMARKYGFTHAECDITWTSDNVCVLHHDETINRTGRNADGSAISDTININEITYAEALTYDFGIYKNPVYAGLKIPKLEDFLVLCRNIGIKPYIEIKPYNITQAKIESLVDMVRRYGMEENSEYISSSPEALTFLKNYNPKASIGYVVGAINTTLIATANSLKTGTNKVFMVSSARTPEAVELCYNNNLPLIVWTVNDVNILRSLDPYVSGILSDMIVMGKCLYDYSIG